MSASCRCVLPLALLTMLGAREPLRAQELKYEIRLKRAWVRAYADRATVSGSMEIRHAHAAPNKVGSGGKDGDLHFSGVSPAVGLPFVAEVINAGLPGQQAAIRAIRAKEASGSPAAITGAWRLWFEHPSSRQTQGANNPFTPDNTNPDHSFEIHPASEVDQVSVGGSFVPIPGYKAYTAEETFPYFDQQVVRIKASQSGLSIRSKRITHNYVEFDIELAQAPRQVQDGYIVEAMVLTAGGEEAANGRRRMVFVEGTTAAGKIQNAASGERFRVLGIPRIDLNAVLAMVAKKGTQQFDAQLPYEMIVVGVR